MSLSVPPAKSAGVRWWWAVLVGAVGAGIGSALTWVPPIWLDEAATILSSTRSFESLGRMIQSIDLVHATYYALMHLWFDVVGVSSFTLRLPSALAIGAASALLVIVLARFGSARVAVIGGLLLAILPRSTWAAAEGRSYALTVLMAVLLTWLLLLALDRTTSRAAALWWALYAAAGILSIAVFLYLALVVAGHAVTVLVLALLRAVHRRHVVAFAVAMGAVIVVAVPYALALSRQVGQVAWIGTSDQSLAYSVLVGQFFDGDRLAAVACALALLAGVVLLARRAVALTDREAARYLAVFVPLLLVPTGLLLAVSLTVEPLYVSRYLTFSLPAVAALMAAAIGALDRRLGAVCVLVLAVIVTPNYLAQRSLDSHERSPWERIAAIIGAGPREATGVAFETNGDRGGVSLGTLAELYPHDFGGIANVTFERASEDSEGIWPESSPVARADLEGLEHIWLVESDGAQGPRDEAVIESAGFGEVGRETVGSVEIVLYGRGQ